MKMRNCMVNGLAMLLLVGAFGSPALRTEAAGEETVRSEGTDGLYASGQEIKDSPEWVSALPSAQSGDVTQLFIVAGAGADKTTATISMHERAADGTWKEVLSTPGYVGKNGLCLDADHKEGCGQTPVGTYRFNKAFGIAADPGCAIPYVQVDQNTYWSGDMRNGRHYNEMVDIRDYPDLDMANSEHIIDYKYQYQYCLNISFNADGTAGRGSAIFLHCFGPENPYTGGCVAVPENIMKLIMQRVKSDCVVIIDTKEHLMNPASAVAADPNYIPEWNPSSVAMQSLTAYVNAVTDVRSKDFIPVQDRIAVFDMDGTLTCETYFTYYDTCMFIDYCLKDHPERVSDELKAAALEIKPGYTAGEELARNFAKAYAGMTVDELYDYAVEFGKKPTDSFNNMRYIDGFYLPMVEVVKYLYDNGFTIYVVSGTERTTTRAIVANSPIAPYVSPAHVIGTEFEVKVRGYENVASNMDFKYNDGDELVLTGGFVQKNLNANKAIWIEREIGQRPVLAFGNSGSDTSMMNYVLDSENPYPSAAFMVVADDNAREWGMQNWEEKAAQYVKQGYIPISMQNDFLRIYPEGITKSGVQYIEPQAIGGSGTADLKDAA